jgi:hypothetical protein
MALLKSSQVVRSYILYAPGIYFTGGYVTTFNKLAKPCSRERVDFVVIGARHQAPIKALLGLGNALSRHPL